MPLRHHSAAGLSRCSAGRWRPWACHATNHKNFIYLPIFTIFAEKKISNKQAIIIINNILDSNIFFLGTPENVDLTFTNISLSQLVENLILFMFAVYISSLFLILI